MDELICPNCQKLLMSIKKVEFLLRTTITKTLMSRCVCGVNYEIRSLSGKCLEISTSSGKREKYLI